jgi:thiosulfate reductase cytochrome b subunit
MWLLMINGLIYLVTGFATGRFRRKLLPITPGGVISDVKAALTFKLAHDDLTKYNYVQKLLYAGIIAVGVVIVLSGLSMWKPVQLSWLVALFGGYDWARYVHFVCMSLIVAFLIVHVVLAILVPKSLRAMIIGR